MEGLRDTLWCEKGQQMLTAERFYDGRLKLTIHSGDAAPCTAELTEFRARRLADLAMGIAKRPVIVCLCGSTRFVDAFIEAQKTETLAGKIVLSIEIVTTQSAAEDPQHVAPEVKQRLDELHLSKIDIADEVLNLNVGGYIGESTRRELEYARARRKPVRFLDKVVV